MLFRFHTSWTKRYVGSFTLLRSLSIIIIGIIVLCVSWYFFIQQPLIKQRFVQKAQQHALRQKIATLHQEQQSLALLEQDNLHEQQKFKKLLKSFSSIRAVLDRFVYLLGKNDLSCQDISPIIHHDIQVNNLVRYTIQLTARGSYHAVYQFLSELSAHKELILMWMHMQRSPQGRLELQVTCNLLAQTEEAL